MPAFLSALSLKTMGWLLVILLVTTFSFGALTVVMYQRQTEIKQTLKETKKALKDEKAETEDKDKQLSGCLSSIAQINQGIADNALAAKLNEDLSQGLASAAIAQLPKLIEKDKKIDPEPAAASSWIKGLFR